MSTTIQPGLGAERERMSALFEEKSPILVEVRFPHMGTSSDWHLCDDLDDLDPILERLGPGAEVRLHSVWDVTDPTGGVVFRR